MHAAPGYLASVYGAEGVPTRYAAALLSELAAALACAQFTNATTCAAAAAACVFDADAVRSQRPRTFQPPSAQPPRPERSARSARTLLMSEPCGHPSAARQLAQAAPTRCMRRALAPPIHTAHPPSPRATTRRPSASPSPALPPTPTPPSSAPAPWRCHTCPAPRRARCSSADATLLACSCCAKQGTAPSGARHPNLLSPLTLQPHPTRHRPALPWPSQAATSEACLAAGNCTWLASGGCRHTAYASMGAAQVGGAYSSCCGRPLPPPPLLS